MSDEKKVDGLDSPVELPLEADKVIEAPESDVKEAQEAGSEELPAKASGEPQEASEAPEAPEVAGDPAEGLGEPSSGLSEDAEVASEDAPGREEAGPVEIEDGPQGESPLGQEGGQEEAAVPAGSAEAPAAGPSAASVGEEGQGPASDPEVKDNAQVDLGSDVGSDSGDVDGDADAAGPASEVGGETSPVAAPSFGEVRTEVSDLGETLPASVIEALRSAGDSAFNFLGDMAELDLSSVGQESMARLQNVRNRAVFFLSAIESVFVRS